LNDDRVVGTTRRLIHLDIIGRFRSRLDQAPAYARAFRSVSLELFSPEPNAVNDEGPRRRAEDDAAAAPARSGSRVDCGRTPRGSAAQHRVRYMISGQGERRLPSPDAQQLATHCGGVMHPTAGGLVAGILLVLPDAR
jgi:hypothetical protein